MTLEYFHSTKKLFNEINTLATYSEHLTDDIKELKKLGYKSNNIVNVRASKNGCNSGILIASIISFKRPINPCRYRVDQEYKDMSLNFNPLQIREVVYRYKLCYKRNDAAKEINFYTNHDFMPSRLWIDDSKTFLKYAILLQYKTNLI